MAVAAAAAAVVAEPLEVPRPARTCQGVAVAPAEELAEVALAPVGAPEGQHNHRVAADAALICALILRTNRTRRRTKRRRRKRNEMRVSC